MGAMLFWLSKPMKNKIIAARRGSPLIVGVGEKEFFIASDIPAISYNTRNKSIIWMMNKWLY
jgi:glucosamine 6-phosphate synthetase-like amidotransferase/phosphosugar isomerase protein